MYREWQVSKMAMNMALPLEQWLSCLSSFHHPFNVSFRPDIERLLPIAIYHHKMIFLYLVYRSDNIVTVCAG